VGKKLILKNHLTPAPTFSFEVLLKYQGMILGKFESGEDLEHGEIDC
jgi:hypothetical protein